MSEPDAAEHALREPHAVEDDWHRPWLGAALVGAVGVAFAIGVIDLPRESAALPDIARQAMEIALPKWGTTEVVSEIVYGSRGWDTFGETFLLLAAVIAVTTLGRAREPRGEYVGESSAGMEEQSEIDPKDGGDASESSARDAEEAEGSSEEPLADPDSVPLGEYAPERAEAMSVVVRVAARSAAVILAVAAVYLAAWGYTPGGGFPAGAAVAGVAILLYTALGRHAVQRVIRPSILEPVEIAGAIAIIVIGLLGLAFHDSMFANWATLAEQQTIRAGGNQQLYSGAELVEVATGLTIAIFTLLGMRHDWTPDEEDDGADGGGSDDGDGGDEA
jgi:multicomponent Na+:H+ antiporter subunit B